MALDTSLAGVSFLQPPPEGHESTSFLRAFETAQEQQSPLYLARVKEAQKHLQMMGFQIQNEELQTQINKNLMEDRIAGRESVSKISEAMSRVKDWSNPSALAEVDAIFSKFPTKEGRAMVDEAGMRHKEALAAKDRSEKNLLTAQVAGARMETELYKAGTKAQVDLIKQQAASDIAAAKLEALQNKVSPQAAERDDLAKLHRQEKALSTLIEENPGRGDLKAMRDDVLIKIDAWNQQHGGLETKIESTPQGTTITTSRAGRGAKPSPEVLTPANVNKAQDSLNQSLMTIDAASRLVPLISSETVGPRAFAESWVKDRVLANLFPDLASEKRANAERVAAELRSTTIRELRSDGNISEKERTQILQAVPEINGPLDSPEHARQLIQASAKTAAIRALVTSKRLRVPTPPSVVNTLEDTDLMRMADLGLISKQEANAIRTSRSNP